MSDTLESLRRKINGAGDLESVVRTMKVLAASNILQYEKAVTALGDYYHTVELGLTACFMQAWEPTLAEKERQTQSSTTGLVVFGSDQGLVGQFNDVLTDFAVNTLAELPGKKKVWAVGERVYARLEDAGLPMEGLFPVPNSVNAITPLVGQILTETENRNEKGEPSQLYIFHNRPKSGAIYEPVSQRLLPLDEQWRSEITTHHWPTSNIPEAINGIEPALQGLIGSYLFVSLFRACAESLASENASRLAAMQRAEKNIDELLEDLNRVFHRLRQSSIDEELFDVISGSEALFTKNKKGL
ncbi:MAG: F0F1 ATP synthase subunit gamma [Bacteroidota bacterium]|nr:F0F1 ATP synthase subunit gamma [Bacteroidota bacterium]